MGILETPLMEGPDPEPCAHEELAYLGEGGRASYYRCRTCGAGVVEDRGRYWVLRSAGA